MVRNPAARVRSGVAVLDVEQFEADVPVGPGSAPAKSDREVAVSGAKPRVPGLGALQVLSRRLAYSRTESPHHYPDNDLVSVAQVAAWISDAPAYGITSYPIGDESSGKRRTGSSRPPDRVTVAQSTLRNAALEVTISSRRRRLAGGTSRQVAESTRCWSSSTSATSAISTRRHRATDRFAFCFAARVACIAGRSVASFRELPNRRRSATEKRLRRRQRSPHARCGYGIPAGVDRRRQPRRKPPRSPRGARRHLRRERLGGCGVRHGAPRTNRRR